jgi:hypothetical protein
MYRNLTTLSMTVLVASKASARARKISYAPQRLRQLVLSMMA